PPRSTLFPYTTLFRSSIKVAAKKKASSSLTFLLCRITHFPFLSAAYIKDLPSGAKLTNCSCSCEVVILLVVDPSTEDTNTSPLETKATSLPSGETDMSLTPPLLVTYWSLLLMFGVRR